ncbi:hypothetical protein KI688_009309 [Linnemannia hyalina]|uniref:PiggyBac transposable element-derived protein domain-containing protein n=1 Tax=Linnemannia hyalina TaxID=64524 RepID=A0A9P7XYR5_9FUNG|nr:hypothetical protein KI688_009309 [Linnemannia hyalina]
MLSTIHKINTDDDFIERIRRCPRNTSTNAANARAIFNGKPRAALKIPKLIDDYNHNMNGVDVSNQFRAYYSTQLAVFRTWMPLFFGFSTPPSSTPIESMSSKKDPFLTKLSVSGWHGI